MALGNIERGRKKFSDCAATYAQAIDAMSEMTDKNTWVTYYYRGICEERSKQWKKAEADMRKALELQPEQPHVLNYLGYSWIDQGINLDEGMKMIKRAVEQRQDFRSRLSADRRCANGDHYACERAVRASA